MFVGVTGGTGFVGSHVVKALIADGHRVRVVHRASSRLDALTGIPEKSLETVIADISDYDTLKKAFRGCEWVFHIAAVADYWRADVQRMMHINVDGTDTVLRASRDANVKRVIFTSSAAAIGLPDNPRQPSNENVPFNLPPEQFPYGYSKSLAEKVVQKAVADGQDVVIVNPTVVMGAGDLNMISGTYLMQVAQWGALVPRSSGGISVTDVRDVALSHVAAAKHGKSGERYILTTANFPNSTWFKMLADAVDVPAPMIPVPNALLPLGARLMHHLQQLGIETPVDSSQVRLGGRYVYFDGRKAWQQLHTPQVSMQESLDATVKWYCEHGML
ncbi:MAG: NAD-dependent epimerase/dehydratase family protein [Chloroflexota bacterium]